MLLDALNAIVHTVNATYSKSAGSVSTAKRCTQFQTSTDWQVCYGVNLRGVPPVISQDTASINGGTHKIEIYLLLVTILVAAQITSGFVLLRNLSWANLLLTLHIALHSKLSTSFENTSSKSA